MPDGSNPITVKVASGIADIPAADWDACAGSDNPFASHAFLRTLEESGSVCGKTGWLPQHLVVENESGGVAACMPLYLKSHSFGEFVFDWAWADAYERAGRDYYPKLQSAVPFTPVTGPRLMVRDGAPDALRDALLTGMVRLAERIGVSSAHVTFSTKAEFERMGAVGLIQRVGRQFHWFNRGYETFEDFLATLMSRKRKAIRKERRAVADAGIVMHVREGGAITEADWDAFYRFYRDTSDRKWGPTYLNRAFFSLLHAAMPERVVLALARSGGRTVAGALNLKGDGALYGRYWGADEHHKFLHFETCYYQAIDYAIAHGLARVEAGAQGPHKVQRGYLPVETYSAHWIADPAFRDAIARFAEEERRTMDLEAAEYAQASPYRRS